MSKPIAVGDLVVVVRHGCAHGKELVGRYLTVDDVSISNSWCPKCGNILTSEPHAWFDGSKWCLPFRWLKRIPPLSKLEGERTEENVREPA